MKFLGKWELCGYPRWPYSLPGGRWLAPTLDSAGDAYAEWGVVADDTMILAVEYTAATPDLAAAKALLLRQYDRLKHGS